MGVASDVKDILKTADCNLWTVMVMQEAPYFVQPSLSWAVTSPRLRQSHLLSRCILALVASVAEPIPAPPEIFASFLPPLCSASDLQI